MAYAYYKSLLTGNPSKQIIKYKVGTVLRNREPDICCVFIDNLDKTVLRVAPIDMMRPHCEILVAFHPIQMNVNGDFIEEVWKNLATISYFIEADEISEDPFSGLDFRHINEDI